MKLKTHYKSFYPRCKKYFTNLNNSNNNMHSTVKFASNDGGKKIFNLYQTILILLIKFIQFFVVNLLWLVLLGT